MFLKQTMTAVVAGLAMLIVAPAAQAQEKLVVWFTKGFYPAEDAALDEMIKKFEAKTGVKVELSKYATQEIIPKSVAALDSGNPPDVAFGSVFDFQVTGKWAFDGKLADVSDVINPIKDKFLKNTVETTYLLNGKTNKRAYYAVPLQQQTMHIQYWKDMLADAGLKESDIPQTWQAYWKFWCIDWQQAYRQKTGKRAFGIGQPMGVDSSDAFYSYLTFMDAYNVKLVDDNGKLLVDQPQARQGLIDSMKDYTQIYVRGCTPPSSTAWKDPDNNVAFHNKTTAMTHNATISIAAKWLDDMNNTTLKAEERAQAKKNYEENIATSAFPRKPDNTTFIYRAAVKTAVVFEQAKNVKRAKEFMSFLVQDENLRPFVEGSLGRWFPVTKAGADSPFWQADSHRRGVHGQFKAGTVPFEFTKNYKFTILNNENVWAKAMNRVINDKVPVEKAVDEMIARIKAVAS
jgi:multiple sugar transport system substrate-binding protein